MRRGWVGAAVACAGAAALGGCTLTAAGAYENGQVNELVFSVDVEQHGATEVPCADVPWLGAELADEVIRCLTVDLGDGAVEATAQALAQDIARAAGGDEEGHACGTSDGETVQCAAFASVPDARDANIEIWVSLSDEDVAALPDGSSAGTYFVTYRLVPYGPQVYREASSADEG